MRGIVEAHLPLGRGDELAGQQLTHIYAASGDPGDDENLKRAAKVSGQASRVQACHITVELRCACQRLRVVIVTTFQELRQR